MITDLCVFILIQLTGIVQLQFAMLWLRAEVSVKQQEIRAACEKSHLLFFLYERTVEILFQLLVWVEPYTLFY